MSEATRSRSSSLAELGEIRGPRLPARYLCVDSGGAGPGPRVLLEVTDTGVGMDAETRRRAFERGFSRRGSTGLGLSEGASLVTGWRGTIRVESRPGRGSRFRFELPRLSSR